MDGDPCGDPWRLIMEIHGDPHLDSTETPWRHRVSMESPLKLHRGVTWISMGSLLWASTNLHGCPRMSMDVHGCSWMFMGLHRAPWRSIHLYVCPTTSVDLHWSPWISMDLNDTIHGTSWSPKELHGDPFISMDLRRPAPWMELHGHLHGPPTTSMDGAAWTSINLHGSPS